jgi:hypothetical protein
MCSRKRRSTPTPVPYGLALKPPPLPAAPRPPPRAAAALSVAVRTLGTPRVRERDDSVPPPSLVQPPTPLPRPLVRARVGRYQTLGGSRCLPRWQRRRRQRIRVLRRRARPAPTRATRGAAQRHPAMGVSRGAAGSARPGHRRPGPRSAPSDAPPGTRTPPRPRSGRWPAPTAVPACRPLRPDDCMRSCKRERERERKRPTQARMCLSLGHARAVDGTCMTAY